MALNFTGRAPPEAPARPPGRAPTVMLSCLGAAAVLAALVIAAALRQHQPPNPAPPMTGKDRAPVAAAAPSPAEPGIVHEAAERVASPTAPAKPQAPDPAVAKARMLAALRQVPHGVITLSVEDDAGAEALARKLEGLFREAGWTVDESSVFGPGSPRRGLAAALGVSPADEAVREAFDAVGFQLQSPPRDAGVIRTPELFVGKPYEQKP